MFVVAGVSGQCSVTTSEQRESSVDGLSAGTVRDNDAHTERTFAGARNGPPQYAPADDAQCQSAQFAYAMTEQRELRALFPSAIARLARVVRQVMR
jgi:hypothetical protein